MSNSPLPNPDINGPNTVYIQSTMGSCIIQKYINVIRLLIPLISE